MKHLITFNESNNEPIDVQHDIDVFKEKFKQCNDLKPHDCGNAYLNQLGELEDNYGHTMVDDYEIYQVYNSNIPTPVVNKHTIRAVSEFHARIKVSNRLNDILGMKNPATLYPHWVSVVVDQEEINKQILELENKIVKINYRINKLKNIE